MIATTLTKVIYLGNGTTRQFPIPFKYSAAETVKVGIYDPNTDKTVILTQDYYVDQVRNAVFYPGYPPGEAPAESEQPGPLPAGKKLVVYRETPLTQEIDLGTKYPLPVIEGMDDKNTMMTQELAEKMRRAIVVDVASDKKPEDLLLEIMNNLRDAVAAMNRAVEAANHAEAEAERSHQEANEAEGSAIDSANSAGAADQRASLAAHSADEARAAANLSKAWAESEGSPDGRPGSRSAKTWAKMSDAAYNGAKAHKETAKEEADNARAAAHLAFKWATSEESPDGAPESKSARKWARESAHSAGLADANRATAVEFSEMAGDSANRADTSKDKANKSAAEAKLAAEEAKDAAEKAKQIAGGNFATPEEVEAKISALVNQAPETLNTLSEIASALGNDPNFATTITALIGQKLGKYETAEHARQLSMGEFSATLRAGHGVLVLNRVGNSRYFEMVPTPGRKLTVGTAENCTGNAATATTAGTAAQASVAHSVPGSDVGGNIWIA